MMGGRLERAVDEVADLVASRPAWMAGDPSSFNEEQLRLYKEYAAKEQAAIEERLKRKAVMVSGAARREGMASSHTAHAPVWMRPTFGPCIEALMALLAPLKASDCLCLCVQAVHSRLCCYGLAGFCTTDYHCFDSQCWCLLDALQEIEVRKGLC